MHQHFYYRTAILLDSICGGVTAQSFYLNFWESVCLSAQLRVNATFYLNNHVMPKSIVSVDSMVPSKHVDFMVWPFTFIIASFLYRFFRFPHFVVA